MRLAVFYDIHSHLPALEAAVDDARQEAVDAFVFGGDIIPGPMPRETLDFVRGLSSAMHCIHGNGDRDIVERLRGGAVGPVPEPYHEALEWNARQLGPGHPQWIASWPSSVTLTVEDIGDVMFCHATARNDTEVFTRLTPEDRVAPMFDGVNAALVVCGHTHMQMDRTVSGTRIVNPGSVGMPFGDPGAYWMLLGPGVEFRRTAYDLEDAAARIRGTRYPMAEHFASANVLQPPSEAQMLARYSR